MINPGIYPNLSNEEYHADSAISRSGVMLYDESAYKYWANYINPDRPKKESTRAMEFGSAFHTYVLENHLFNEIYGIKRPKVLLRDVGRKLYDEVEEYNSQLESSHKIIISHDDFMLICNMFISLKKHEKAWDLIQDAVYEQSYFWKDKESGLILKARPDILHHNIIVDLKTCTNASTRAYQRSMVDGGYHIQGAMTQEGIYELKSHFIPNVINICIETKYPHEIAIKIIHEEALEAGRKKFKSVIMDMSRDIVHNEYKQYDIEIVDLPRWYNG